MFWIRSLNASCGAMPAEKPRIPSAHGTPRMPSAPMTIWNQASTFTPVDGRLAGGPAAGGGYGETCGCPGGAYGLFTRRSLPLALARHRSPRLGLGQRLAALEQLDRLPVGRLHEGHPPVARRAEDRDALGPQLLAGRVDVVDLVGEVPEEPARRVR